VRRGKSLTRLLDFREVSPDANTSLSAIPRPTQVVGFDQGVEVTNTNETSLNFEKKLLQQQADLQRAMLSAVEQGRETVTDETQDVADQAVASYQKELLFSQGTTGHVQLTLIRAALDRLADGSFGECLNCGTRIGTKRLEALPWTPYCINCQEKIENGEIEDPVRAA
jgi:DnaK suppressor protein